MKVLLIGAAGTMGSAVAAALAEEDITIIPVGQHSGDLQVDIASEDSIRSLFEKAGPFDGLICVAGSAYSGPLTNMDAAKAYIGINNKLMGQVNLVLIGKNYVNEGGFFTLTSGNLAEEGSTHSADLGLVNGALNGFVVNAALEMPKGIRLNVVSPSVLTESVAQYGEPENRESIPAAEVAKVYKETVMGKMNGQVLRAYGKRKNIT